MVTLNKDTVTFVLLIVSLALLITVVAAGLDLIFGCVILAWMVILILFGVISCDFIEPEE